VRPGRGEGKAADLTNRRKRLLYLVTRSVFGGAQSHVLTLLTKFRAEYDVALGVGCEGQLTEGARSDGIDVHILPHLMSRPWPVHAMTAVWEIKRLILRVQPDLVSTHSFKAGLAGRLAATQCGVASVHTAHGWPFSPGVPWLRRQVTLPIERRAAAWCRRIIAVSEADYELGVHRHVARPEQLVTVQNGVPDSHLRAEPGRPGRPEIVMVGRFEPQKDFPLLLRAIHGLPGDVHATLVGDGPTRVKAEALSRRLGLSGYVRFLGFRSDVAEILSDAQVFVLASRWEGLPRSVLEAMRAGVPVVASDVGGVGEAVVDGDSGFLIPRGNVEALRRRLGQLCADSKLRERMGAAARSRYEIHFVAERMLRETLQVYREVLAGVPDGRA
jgi:glycosyltransferase involved in cell wall biosynthesis